MKNLSKRMISLMLAAIMAMPAVLVMPFAAEAEDAPSSAYWSILASTDFTQTSWSGSGSSWYASTSPTTSAGGHNLGWNINYNDSESGVAVNSKGVNFHYNSNSDRDMGFMYLSSFKIGKTIYNSSNYRALFDGVSSFKIDLAFSYLGTAKAATGNTLDQRRGNNTFFKLANDTGNKLGFSSKYNYQANYFSQEPWGRRHFNNNNDVYATGNSSSGGTQEGGAYAITTSDNLSSGGLTANSTYHYVVYVADGWLGCYVADASGNLVINYDSIKLSDLNNFGLTPADITSIYLGGSEWNWAGKYEVDNIAYKSIEIYKGVDTSTYDSTRNKYLYAYFTGNSAEGETMHYAISQDGLNFETVNGGAKVWDGSEIPATETYPTADSAPYSDSVAISNHVRDSYAFIGQDGKCYVIATDLNTNNGDWGNIQNSRFLMWKMDAFADISETRPWTIDTARITGMDAVTGATSSSHKTVKKAWAPQVLWDADEGKYMLYWSVGADGISTQIYYTYTSDFKTDFTAPKRLLEPSKSYATSGMDAHIDADITYNNGLYYCFFKNEDGSGTGSKKIWYAVSPNANGPYSGFTLFNTSYGAEGPQVFETAENSYLLMVDGYGDGSYHMYSSGSLSGFSTSNESSTNIGNISPRHGSILRISDAEYSKLKKLRTGGKKYKWETTASYGHNSNQTDSTGNPYHVTWNPNPSTTTTGNGVLSITDSGIYVDDSDVCSYFHSGVYSASFFYKSSASTTKDDEHSLFSISKSKAVENYVRVSSNGKFFVNGTQVTPANSARSTAFANAVNDTENFHKFTVTCNGAVTSLIIDGQFICGVGDAPSIQEGLWITFGWARIAGVENNRLTAQFGQLTFKPFATETGAEDEFFDLLKPSSVEPVSWTAKARLVNEIADSNAIAAYNGDNNGFNNVVYATNQENVTSDYGYDDIRCYFTSPKNVVLAYDGNKIPSLPVAFGGRCEKSWGSAKKFKVIYCAMSGSKFELKGYWRGYVNWGSGFVYTSSNTTLENYLSSASSSYSNVEHDNTNTPRVYFNKMFYKGSGAGSSANYVETITDTTLTFKNSRKGSGCPYSVAGPIYVINYKPIRDILTGTVPGSDLTATQLMNLTDTWKYTTESYSYALAALKKVAAINPKDTTKYTYGTDMAAAALQCGKDIKAAVDAWDGVNLVKRTFSVQYRMADGRTIAEMVTAGDTLASVPSASSVFHIDGTDTHMASIGWSSVTHDTLPTGSDAWNPSATPTSSVVPRANTVYTESGTPAACNTSSSSHTAATALLNGFTDYACSACGYIDATNRRWDSQSWETYNTNYTAYENKIAEENYATKYTTTSKNNLATAITNNALDTMDVTIPQTVITTNAGNIGTAVSGLDELADLTAIDRAYNKANTLLISLDGKAPQYTEASINELISVVNSAKTVYINGDRSDIGKKANSKPDEAKSIALATSINNAIAGLETIEKDNPTTQEELDLSVYNEAVARINNLDPEAYDVDSDSIKTALRVVKENLLNEDIKTVEYETSTINVLNTVNMTNIDNASFAILNALSNSIKHYDVITDANVTTGFKNGEVSSAAAPDENHKKSSVTYGASIVCISENEDTAWFLSYSVDGKSRMTDQFQGKGKVFKGKVYGDTVIKAVQKNSGKHEVKIVRHYYDGETKESGEPIHYLTYVENKADFTLPPKKAFPYYRCDGYFYTDGSPVEGNTISDIQSDIVIIAKYTKDTTLSYTIGVTGGTGAPADSVGYNTRVNLTGNAGTIGWLEKVNATDNEYRPFYYGKDVSFLTTESVDLLATSDATKFENIPCINLRQSGAEAQIIGGVRKITFNGQIVFDSDVFIVDTSGSEDTKAIMEYGILVGAARSTGGYVPDESQLTVENSGSHDEFGVLRAKSTKLVGANQFSITINNLPANYIYRGYVIYKDETGKMHTKYSPAVNV